MINHNWLKSVTTFSLGWIVSLLIWQVIRKVGIKTYLDSFQLEFSFLNVSLFILVLSLIAGAIFGSVQYYNERYSKQYTSFKSLLFRALIIHVIIMLFLYLIVYLAFRFSKVNLEILFREFLQNPIIIINLLYSLLINSIIVIVIYLNKLFGKGNLSKLLTGRFYNPKEEFRIFMFLDLQSSTKLAEDLGHIKYSKFIQDCFYDLSVIESTKIEIYQYVGDEAVLTFKLDKNGSVDNALDAFFLYYERLKSRQQHYLDSYGAQPIFKAGMHLGVVTVAEVGSLKREIAYHGDTINIASRIQGQCKVYNRNFLISDSVIDHIKHKDNFLFEALDQLILRGKKESTTLYSVSKKES